MALTYTTDELQRTLDKVVPLEGDVADIFTGISDIRIDAFDVQQRVEVLEGYSLRNLGTLSADALYALSSAKKGHTYRMTTPFSIGTTNYLAGAFVTCLQPYDVALGSATALVGYWAPIGAQTVDGDISLDGVVMQEGEQTITGKKTFSGGLEVTDGTNTYDVMERLTEFLTELSRLDTLTEEHALKIQTLIRGVNAHTRQISTLYNRLKIF